MVSCKNPFEKVLGISDENSDYAIQTTENGKVLLRFKPEIGNKTITEMKFEVKPESSFIPLNSEVIADLVMRVVSVEDSGTICHLDFQRFRMKTSLMGAKINYDSQSSENSVPKEMTGELEKFLGKKIILNIDSLAQVKVMRFEEDGQPIGTKSVDLYTQFVSLPQQEIGVGDSWIIKQPIYILGEIDLKYTLDKISDTEIVVKVDSGDDRENLRVVKGQYLMDRKTGFVKKGELDIKDNGQKVGLKITIASTIE